MFPLLIFFTVLTLPLTGEASTIEYWVRPDTVLECPQDTPQHQCVTVTDLVSYSTNSSLNQGRNITIHFLPGVHTPRVGGRILIENKNWTTMNLTATVTGEQSSSGFKATIKCGLSKITFVAHQIPGLIVRNLKIINCGNETGTYLSGDLLEYFDVRSNSLRSHFYSKVASLAIINEAPTQNSVFMDHVTVDKSSGYGVLVVQYCSDRHDNARMSSQLHMHATNSIIQCSNNRHNLLVLTDSEFYLIAYHLKISHSCVGFARPRTYLNGGMKIVAINGYLTLHLHNSKFVGNKALNGGGLNILYLKSTDYRSYGRVEINNCTFLSNEGVSGGGLFVKTFDASISVSVKNTLFNENTVGMLGGKGGAMFMESSAYANLDGNSSVLSIEECIFMQNTAKSGAAIFSTSNPHSTIIVTLNQCLFTNNKGAADFTLDNDNVGSVIWVDSSTICLDKVNITDNNCRGLRVSKSTVIIDQAVVISNNHAVGGSGGGIFVDCRRVSNEGETQFLFNKESHLNIMDNRADKQGGGIYTKDCYRHVCDCPIISVNNATQPVVSMANNIAEGAGNSIYGGNLNAYIFWKIFSIVEKNSSAAISSPPLKACMCSSDYFTQELDCKATLNTTIFPGQTLNVSVMCVGQLGYPSSCVFEREMITKGAKVALVSKVEDVKTQCINFSYVIRTQSKEMKRASLTLLSDIEASSMPHFNAIVIQIHIDDCPLGFKTVLNDNNLVCTCSDHLHREGIVCNIDELTLYKTSPMWVGNYSGDITVHRNCPFGYCKTNFTAVNIFNQQDQCDWNRSGVLCGACRPGLSLVLGTSQCKQCSNLHLLLLIPLALAGVLLVLLLLKCNLTVSMGTINGLIFYANVVQATKTAFFPTGSNSTFTHILSVFIAWLNLDLGIETCFAEGLNTYHRTWLQFVFPVYIWSLVGVMIVVNRYSIRVSRWTGSNTVSVLATLFLLSYAKLLRVTFDVFTSTSLTDANGTTTLVWLLDGDYVFLQWPHSLLFTAALVTLLGHIVPFTALLLVSPTLQRYSHHKPLRWVNRMKPLLDAYQGPYKNKVRYWTGLLLFVRLIILSANAINVTGNQAVSLFTTNIVVTIMLLYIWVMVGNKLYRNRLPYFLEVFFIGNLQLFSLASLFLSSDKEVRLNAQEHLTYCMVCSTLVVFMLTLVYHYYKLCLNTRQGKKAHQKLVSLVKKPEADFEEHSGADLAAPKHSSTPTTTVVELKEPLLVDDTQ